eukprot:m.231069 g.231069  ORF g.231069 m.231069 type:complete len:159 (-) comp22420_c1_seq1:63-539(-)
MTPLHYAAVNGHHNTAQALLAACPTAVSAASLLSLPTRGGETALHLACLTGRSDVVRLLLEQPDIDLNTNTPGRCMPLHLACLKGHRDVVRLLVGAGCDLHSRNARRETPRDVAVARQHWAVVDLLDRRASIGSPERRRHRDREELHACSMLRSSRRE